MIKKFYYVREDVGISNNESNYRDFDENEYLFLAIKKGSSSTNSKICVKESISKKKDKVEGTLVFSFHVKEDKNYWVVDSGYSNHMTRDKSNFAKLEKYNGGLVKFGDDFGAKIYGIGSNSFDGMHSTDNVYYVNGFGNNLLAIEKCLGRDIILHLRIKHVRSEKGQES